MLMCACEPMDNTTASSILLIIVPSFLTIEHYYKLQKQLMLLGPGQGLFTQKALH